jgi:hypothetical protein
MRTPIVACCWLADRLGGHQNGPKTTFLHIYMNVSVQLHQFVVPKVFWQIFLAAFKVRTFLIWRSSLHYCCFGEDVNKPKLFINKTQSNSAPVFVMWFLFLKAINVKLGITNLQFDWLHFFFLFVFNYPNINFLTRLQFNYPIFKKNSASYYWDAVLTSPPHILIILWFLTQIWLQQPATNFCLFKNSQTSPRMS